VLGIRFVAVFMFTHHTVMIRILLIVLAVLALLSSCNRDSRRADGQDGFPADSAANDGVVESDSADPTYMYHQGTKQVNAADSIINDGHSQTDSTNRTYPYHH
jgi:hypothetical protein